MSTRTYPNGYGRVESPPECMEGPEITCPCCGGEGEHPFGQGMDQDAAECRTCGGQGRILAAPARRGAGA